MNVFKDLKFLNEERCNEERCIKLKLKWKLGLEDSNDHYHTILFVHYLHITICD